jgi:hypothetical protein
LTFVADINDATAPNICNILLVLRSVFDNRPIAWYADNLPYLQSCVQKILATEQVKVIDGLVGILSNVYQQIAAQQQQQPQQLPAPIQNFTQFVTQIVVDGLQNQRNIYGMMTMLHALQPPSNDYVAHLMKLLTRYVYRLS